MFTGSPIMLLLMSLLLCSSVIICIDPSIDYYENFKNKTEEANTKLLCKSTKKFTEPVVRVSQEQRFETVKIKSDTRNVIITRPSKDNIGKISLMNDKLQIFKYEMKGIHDVIVNAANTNGLGGGGIDGAIHQYVNDLILGQQTQDIKDEYKNFTNQTSKSFLREYVREKFPAFTENDFEKYKTDTNANNSCIFTHLNNDGSDPSIPKDKARKNKLKDGDNKTRLFTGGNLVINMKDLFEFVEKKFPGIKLLNSPKFLYLVYAVGPRYKQGGSEKKYAREMMYAAITNTLTVLEALVPEGRKEFFVYFPLLCFKAFEYPKDRFYNEFLEPFKYYFQVNSESKLRILVNAFELDEFIYFANNFFSHMIQTMNPILELKANDKVLMKKLRKELHVSGEKPSNLFGISFANSERSNKPAQFLGFPPEFNFDVNGTIKAHDSVDKGKILEKTIPNHKDADISVSHFMYKMIKFYFCLYKKEDRSSYLEILEEMNNSTIDFIIATFSFATPIEKVEESVKKYGNLKVLHCDKNNLVVSKNLVPVQKLDIGSKGVALSFKKITIDTKN